MFFRVQGLGFGVWGLGFGVWGLGFGVACRFGDQLHPKIQTGGGGGGVIYTLRIPSKVNEPRHKPFLLNPKWGAGVLLGVLGLRCCVMFHAGARYSLFGDGAAEALNPKT